MWTLTNNKDWQHLLQYSWVADMQGVPQDKVHHAEGDVAIHTQMVLHALLQMPEYLQLNALQQEILWTAALLHDVEKRNTTVTEPDGSITAKGHARKGAMTARQLLYKDFATPFAIREQIVNLVRYHGLPLWAIEKPDAAKAVLQAGLVVDTQLLAILAKADALGRICADTDDLLHRIELFKALCIENDTWGKARQFATPAARFEYFGKEDRHADYVPYEDFGTRVVLMAGLPGAGKDSYVARNYADAKVINLDDIRRSMKVAPTDKSGNGRVIQYAKEMAKTYLRNKQDFVWNATNITYNMRSQLVDLFTTYKAHVTIVYVEVPYTQLLLQNKSRAYDVPDKVVARLTDKLEVPAPWEAHDVQYSIGQ